MHQIVYISTRSSKMTGGDLSAIIAASRNNNAAAGVTGMLLFNGRRFMQALEGPEAEVTVIYDRLRADPRHIALVELSRRTVAEREFGPWAMAHDEGDEASRAGFLARVETLTATASPSIRAQFRGYAGLQAA